MASKQNVISLYPDRGARPKHIYNKLDEARQQRAKALANRDAANVPAPVVPLLSPVVRKMTDDAEPLPAPEPTDAEAAPYARDDLAASSESGLPKGLIAVTVLAALGLGGLLLLPRDDAVALSEPVASDASSAAAQALPAAPVSFASVLPLTAPTVPQGSDAPVLAMSQALPTQRGPDIAAPSADAPVAAVAPVTVPSVQAVSPTVVALSVADSFDVARPGPSDAVAESEVAALSVPVQGVLPFVSAAPEGLPVRPAARTATLADAAVDEPMPLLLSEDAPAGSLFEGKAVFLHAPDALSAERIAALQSEVEGLGVPEVEIRLTGLRISDANVRYFHIDDAEAAAGVAEATGAELRDFTDFRPSPRDGLIELWIDGAPQARAPVPTRAQPLAARRTATPIRTLTRTFSPARVQTRARDGGGGSSLLESMVRDVTTTLRSGAKKTVDSVEKGVSSGVDRVSSGLGKANGKAKGNAKDKRR